MSPISATSILEELGRILASSLFANAEQSRALLKYVVERTVHNGTTRLKEYTVGAEALGRGPSFDPRTDTIVRAEASRLRSRLERYYAAEGRADPVEIVLPKGTYVPQFIDRKPPPEEIVLPTEPNRQVFPLIDLAEVREGTEVDAPATPVPTQPRLSKKRAWKWALTAATVLLASIAAGIGLFSFHNRKILTEKDFVVIADFENTTGEPVFDQTLRQGLEVELEQSSFLNLVSEERIRETLSRMGEPADVQLTPTIAREICERTASAAVMEGSIEKLGSHYILGLRASSCVDGQLLAEEQVQAADKDEVLNALSDIATRFRIRVGESLKAVKKHNSPLADATTPSLEALKAYSAGWRTNYASGAAAAVPLFKRAIQIDPNFAMAYAALGRLYGDIGETELSAESSTKAYELRDRASDEERYWISAAYDMQVTGNLEKAEQTCKSWSEAYPRSVVPHAFSSGTISLVPANYERSIEEAKAALGLDPDIAIVYSNLALSYVALGRIGEAERTLSRASERKLTIPDFFVQRYTLAFLKNDPAGMSLEAHNARVQLGEEDWMSNAEGFTLASTGHLKEAREKSREAEDLAHAADLKETEALYDTDEALREALFGNSSVATERASKALKLSSSREVEYAAGFALALSRDVSRAEKLTGDLSVRFPEDTKVRFAYSPTLRALLALNRNQPLRAIELLRTAIPFEAGILSTGGSEFLLGTGNLYPAYVRGEAYLTAHQGPEAVIEFQKILNRRGIVLVDPISALARFQIGRAYALAGDNKKAHQAFGEFLTLWKDADPDIPFLTKARAEDAKLQ